MSFRNLKIALAVAGIALAAGCSDSNDSKKPGGGEVTGFSATVHRTEGGFPHIVANDWGSLGFGTGYAAAQDNFCALARNILKYRAQQSKYLGAGDDNLQTDLFYQYLIESGIYNHAISPELESTYAGYAAGFNHYLRNTGVANIPDPACQGATWIQQMSTEDVRRVHLTPAFLPRLATLFLAATPPAAVAKSDAETGDTKEGQTNTGEKQLAATAEQEQQATTKPAALTERESMELAALITDLATAKDKGSNGVAIGRDLTDHSGGILYTNPHLDWDLSFRFYPMHQIIPGVTNQLGANTYERAAVGFGTNGDVAWTNTVTASRTQSLYELELAPGNPMAYIFDGEEEAIEAITVTVDVLGDDGNLSQESHTFYRSRHGLLIGLLFGWDMETAFALRIADEGPRGQQGQAIALARAKNVHDVLAASNKYQASPNINTIAADSSGEVLYGDLGPVANMTDAQLTDCATDTPVAISFFAPAFYGNTSDCTWKTNEDSAADGILGASQRASLIRTDYATNSNDSFWLANPNAPITGIPMVQGDIEDERTVRTRSGLHMIQQRIDGTDGLPGTTFDIDSVIERLLSNLNYAGLILRDDLVTLCENNSTVTLNDEPVNISAACPVLTAWDVHSNLESRGAHLFREFMRAAHGGSASVRTLPDTFNYAVPFDVNDPVNTPRGLDTSDNPAALQALAEAVVLLGDAGIALDTQLGDLQSTTKNDTVIPLHGGEEIEGVFNKMSLEFAGSEGYPAVTGSGASWVMAVEFGETGPIARGILSYSLSANTTSEHYADMTEMFSRKEFLDLPFHQEDVEAAALSTIDVSEGTSACADGGWETFLQPQFADEQACRDYFIDIEANQLLDFVEG